MRISLLLAFAGLAAGVESFTGVVTDTLCGAKHTMMKRCSMGRAG